jgi:hypothetical protein
VGTLGGDGPLGGIDIVQNRSWAHQGAGSERIAEAAGEAQRPDASKIELPGSGGNRSTGPIPADPGLQEDHVTVG